MSEESGAEIVCCPDWPVQIAKLNVPIVLQSVRSGGSWQYDGIEFRYCPWCGKKRVKEGESENKKGGRRK
mgnify:CR=1 FL=1